jgi:hypothetical protein
MKSWQIWSSSPVVTPGLTCGAIIVSTLAAARPAARMPAMSAGELLIEMPLCCLPVESIA